MIFPDVTLYHTIHFERPGAMHYARWMAKSIKSSKIFSFRGEFRLTARETKNLRKNSYFHCFSLHQGLVHLHFCNHCSKTRFGTDARVNLIQRTKFVCSTRCYWKINPSFTVYKWRISYFVII